MSPLSDFVSRTDNAMYVVTARSADERAGCLVGFGCQVSIEPERFLVAISTANHTYRVAGSAEILAVHLLPASATALAALFGETTGDTTDKFASCRFHDGPDGVPILDDSIAVLVGRVLQRIVLGDHTGYLLEPLDTTVTGADAPPYTFSQTRTLHPGHPVT